MPVFVTGGVFVSFATNHDERSLDLSALTKIMIFLLSLFSLFLCGTVVTYVGNASNYKELMEEQESINKEISSEIISLQRQYTEKMTLIEQLKAESNDRIQLLEDQINQLDVEKRNAERKSLEYAGRVNSWVGVVTGFEQTIENLQNSLKLTQVQLDKARTDGIEDRKELNEITASLYEKIVQLQSLEVDKRRLLEQKTSLEQTLNNVLDTGGGPVSVEPVTPAVGRVRRADATIAGVDLKGLVTEVGQSLVTISLGSADGVVKNMLFHVTRGDEFICDVVITDVDTNKAAGVIELKLTDPRVGDNVSTKL